jgi:hypothetical protein
MQPYAVAVDTTNQNVSPWWHWGLAIFIAFMALISALGAAVSIAFGPQMWRDELASGWEVTDPGPYPENGTAEEQASWNETNEEFEAKEMVMKILDEVEESRIIEIQAIASGILFLSAIPLVIMLFSQHSSAFKYTGYWMGAGLVATLAIQIYSQSLTERIFAHLPEDVPNYSSFSMALGIAQTITCYSFLFAILALCSIQSKKGSIVPQSGFHSTEVGMVVVSHDITPVTTAVLSSPYLAPPQPVKQTPESIDADVIVGNRPDEQ